MSSQFNNRVVADKVSKSSMVHVHIFKTITFTDSIFSVWTVVDETAVDVVFIGDDESITAWTRSRWADKKDTVRVLFLFFIVLKR